MMTLWRNNINLHRVTWFKRLHNSTTPSFVTVGVLLKLLLSTIISPFFSPELSRLTPVPCTGIGTGLQLEGTFSCICMHERVHDAEYLCIK